MSWSRNAHLCPASEWKATSGGFHPTRIHAGTVSSGRPVLVGCCAYLGVMFWSQANVFSARRADVGCCTPSSGSVLTSIMRVQCDANCFVPIAYITNKFSACAYVPKRKNSFGSWFMMRWKHYLDVRRLNGKELFDNNTLLADRGYSAERQFNCGRMGAHLSSPVTVKVLSTCPSGSSSIQYLRDDAPLLQ